MKKNTFFFMAVSGVIILVVIISTFLLEKSSNTCFSADNKCRILNEWTINNSDAVTLPCSINGRSNEKITVSTVFNEQEDEKLSLMYMSNYCISRVYLDGKEIGSYGTERPSPFGYVLGNIRVVVPLPSDSYGKEIKIEIIPVYTQSMEIPVVMYGLSSDLRFMVLRNNIWRIAVCCFLFTIFLLSTGFAVFQTAEKAFHSNIHTFWYFSGFVLCVVIWLICSSDIPQFFTGKNETAALASYMSLAVMGIPYIGYCRHIFSNGKTALRHIELCGFVIPLAVSICFIFNIADPPQLLVLTHIYMGVVVLSSLYQAISEWKTNPDSRKMVYSMIFLMSAAFVGLVCYYTRPTSGLDAVAFGGGFLVYMIFLSTILISREVRYIKERMSMDIYRDMAYKDKLTGCGNRAALDAAVEEAENCTEDRKFRWMTVMMIDLNHLKTVNDTLGHEAGDELIRGCAWCLTEAFSGSGTVFRLGGDEFTVLLWNEKNSMTRFLEKLDEAMDIYNAKHENKVSMAKGFAECEWIKGTGLFQKTFRKADELMYKDKERCHEADNIK